jgi:hypothetical protein
MLNLLVAADHMRQKAEEACAPFGINRAKRPLVIPFHLLNAPPTTILPSA